jgi:hypothetical protein
MNPPFLSYLPPYFPQFFSVAHGSLEKRKRRSTHEPCTQNTMEENQGEWRKSLVIQRSGALTPAEDQDRVLLKYPPLARNAFGKILDDAINHFHPTVIFGAYQSGKMTLLSHMSRELRRRGIESRLLSLNELLLERQSTEDITQFYAYVSKKIFGDYLSGRSLLWRLSQKYGDPDKDFSKKQFVILIDELQAVIGNNEWLSDAADFLLVLASLAIPFIAVGTFDSTKLQGVSLFPKAIKPAALTLRSTANGPPLLPSEDMDIVEVATLQEPSQLSPVNKQDCHRMDPFTAKEMFTMLNKYDEFYPSNKVPSDIRLALLGESNGHASSFMSLLSMYHSFSPSSDEWPGTLMDHSFDFLNGVKVTIINALKFQVPVWSSTRIDKVDKVRY